MKRLDSLFDGIDERETAYVLARSECVSNSEALRKCGQSEGWLYKCNVEDLNSRADEIRKNKAFKACQILDGALIDAVTVKVSGLKSRDDRMKQAVATEIIERGLGKVPTKTELTGKDGKPLSIEVDDARESIQRKLAGISTASDEG